MKPIGYLLLVCVVGCASKEKKAIMVGEDGQAFPALQSTYQPLAPIGNVHTLREDERILRGASPEGKAALLKQQRVTDVLIFRKVSDNAKRERDELHNFGYSDSQIHHVPMRWHKLQSTELACRDVVAGLKVMKEVEDNPRRKLYLHCTMGEDRTGLISGLYRMVFQNWSAERAYQQEMCGHGFADSNPRKPVEVVKDVNESLKTLYARMAVLVESGVLSKDTLDPEVCRQIVSEYKLKRILDVGCH